MNCSHLENENEMPTCFFYNNQEINALQYGIGSEDFIYLKKKKKYNLYIKRLGNIRYNNLQNTQLNRFLYILIQVLLLFKLLNGFCFLNTQNSYLFIYFDIGFQNSSTVFNLKDTSSRLLKKY